MDTSGNISWTNNGDLPNPDTVNIKGPQGIQGESGVWVGENEPTNPEYNVWIDPDGQGGETDPIFTASAAYGIQSSDITDWNGKQAQLVSGTNIKTINNESLLGSGNISISSGGGTWGSITGTLSDQTDLNNALGDKQATIDSSHKLSADLVDDTSTTNKFVTASDKTTWSGKQDALVSGTNIKTINNTSLLGSGNIATVQVSDSYSTSTTDAYSANKVNNLIEKNIITAYFTSNHTITTNDYETLPLSNSISVGNKLTLSTQNNSIVVGSGVSKVKVSAKISFNSVDSSGLKWLTIFNGNYASSANPCNLSSRNMIYATDTIIEVQQGDNIYLKANGASGDVIRSTSTYTNITVEVVE